MLVIIMMLVIGLVIAESNFARETSLREEFKRTVYGRVADGRVFLLDKPVKIIRRQMLLRTQKSFQDNVTLARPPETGRSDVIIEDRLLHDKFFFLFTQGVNSGVPIAILPLHFRFRYSDLGS